MTCYQCGKPGHLVRRVLTPKLRIPWLVYKCRACVFEYISAFDGKKCAHPTWIVPEVKG